MSPMSTHYARALEEISNARGAIEHLDTLYRIPHADRPNHIVGKAHSDLGHALALARVEALLEIGDQLSILVNLVSTNARPLGVRL